MRKKRVKRQGIWLNNSHVGWYRLFDPDQAAAFFSNVLGPKVSHVVAVFIVGVVGTTLCFTKYRQVEIVDPSDNKYLGFTVEHDWYLCEDLGGKEVMQ